jgi:hypothetical protein
VIFDNFPIKTLLHSRSEGRGELLVVLTLPPSEGRIQDFEIGGAWNENIA